MYRQPDSFYHDAICNIFPDAHHIRRPDVPGMVSPVFLVDTQQTTRVCKFNEPAVLARNAWVARILNDHDVPAPRTSVHGQDNVWFESYSYCPDKTLYEHITLSNPDVCTFNAFQNILSLEHKISQIDVNEFRPSRYRYFYEVHRSNMKNLFSSSLASFYSTFTYLLSQYGTLRLFHNDLHAKNVLTPNGNNISRILDLDAVALGNENFCLTTLLRQYPGPESDYKHLLNFYEELVRRKVNRRVILGTLKILVKIRQQRIRLLDRRFMRGK